MLFLSDSKQGKDVCTLIQHIAGISSQCNMVGKGIEGILIGKKKKQNSLFADYIVFYVENSKKFTKILQSELSRSERYDKYFKNYICIFK